jgi:hypothetical protein
MALHQQLDELIQRVLPVVQDFHRKGMFAPHAASIDKAGTLAGHALTTDGTTQLSVSQAIEHFESRLSQQANVGEIQAAGIFYHSPGIDASGSRVSLPPASNTDECRTLVASLEHASGDSVYLLIPYSGEPPVVEYAVGKLIEKPAKVFSPKQNQERRPWWKLW